ncbi:MAG TPA: hypothetical protein PLV87_17015, partial [Opitutaceae bacterium]|nr:hypothetical protein [Opitutaceae bacterium]
MQPNLFLRAASRSRPHSARQYLRERKAETPTRLKAVDVQAVILQAADAGTTVMDEKVPIGVAEWIREYPEIDLVGVAGRFPVR